MWAKQKTPGFTVVELLIVIVVIAILAAIVIVAYNGIQGKAYDTTVQSDLSTFGQQIEIARSDTGTYPTTLTSAMGFKFSRGAYGQDYQGRNLRYCYNSANDTYILLANSKSGNYFKVSGGTVTSTPSAYGWGVCSQIGLVNINPSQDGFNASRSPQWDTWIN